MTLSKVESKIFITPTNADSRIKNFDEIKIDLETLAINWVDYLKKYISVTGKIFGKPEYLWETNERVLVSSLAASIMQNNKNALIAEELPVHKASAKINAGRCDLWAHIPHPESNEHFSFYLEAKRFRKIQTIDTIQGELCSEQGIARMLQDNAKATNGRINLRSAYAKTSDRKHSHNTIGMIVVPMQGEVTPVNDIKNIFNDVYCSSHKIENLKRDMSKFPSVGVYLGKSIETKSEALMFASFSVVGRSEVSN